MKSLVPVMGTRAYQVQWKGETRPGHLIIDQEEVSTNVRRDTPPRWPICGCSGPLSYATVGQIFLYMQRRSLTGIGANSAR